jgi:hypothetical protein
MPCGFNGFCFLKYKSLRAFKMTKRLLDNCNCELDCQPDRSSKDAHWMDLRLGMILN